MRYVVLVLLCLTTFVASAQSNAVLIKATAWKIDNGVRRLLTTTYPDTPAFVGASGVVFKFNNKTEAFKFDKLVRKIDDNTYDFDAFDIKGGKCKVLLFFGEDKITVFVIYKNAQFEYKLQL